ncbi:MAG: hypothetical protein E7419_01045 [Ruminococcaceae bacterium]|nr:hypothetical protein [Oscillospiraceae bacterium]
MKVKETFKTIILTGLVISTLVLSSEIWLSEELWPEGYNSFLSGVFSIFKGNNADSLDLSQIYYPKQILVSKNERSKIVTTNDERYEELNNLLKGHIKTSLLSGEAATASSEEFKNACKENSLFIGLYSFISFEMLADYYGANVTSTVSDINHVKNILFCPLEDSSGFIMYVKNNESGKIFKISVSENIEKLQDMIDKILSRVNEGTVSASFAFENNFDKKAEGEEAKILLDSYMLINLSESSVPGIEASNLLDLSGGSYEQISRYFGVNTNTARRFTDTFGTVNFVENFGTLKFYQDGLLEYTSIDSGIDLNANISSDYDAVKLAGEFTEGVNNLFTLPENNSYVFAGVKEDENTVYTVSFDILYKGVPVVLERELSNKETLTHPIEIKIKNNRIISYRQLFCGFKNSGDKLTVPNMISVLDKFYLTFDVKNNPDIIIDDIYNIYHYNIKENITDSGNGVLLSNGKVVMVK